MENKYSKNKVIRGQTTAVGNVISNVLRKLETRIVETDGAIFKVWDEVVDEDIAKDTRPIRLHKKKLQVEVNNSSLLFELSRFKAEEIRDAINKRLGPEAVEEIVFRCGTR